VHLKIHYFIIALATSVFVPGFSLAEESTFSKLVGALDVQTIERSAMTAEIDEILKSPDAVKEIEPSFARVYHLTKIIHYLTQHPYWMADDHLIRVTSNLIWYLSYKQNRDSYLLLIQLEFGLRKLISGIGRDLSFIYISSGIPDKLEQRLLKIAELYDRVVDFESEVSGALEPSDLKGKAWARGVAYCRMLLSPSYHPQM